MPRLSAAIAAERENGFELTIKAKLGQNFLNDSAASLRIVEALGDISGTTVLEIGPGKGAITKLLASRAQRLIAVEFDSFLATQLQEDYAGNDRVQVVQQDILTADLTELAGAEKLAVVGNLPYYITSQILLHLFEHHAAVDRAVLMVQREVAERIAAEPGTRDYGLLTATTQLYARVDNLFTLPPTAFSPPPDVFSTVIRLKFDAYFARLGVNPSAFIDFLRQIFAQKRKTLANNLRFSGQHVEELSQAFSATNISPGIRAEALPLEAAARLFLALQTPPR